MIECIIIIRLIFELKYYDHLLSFVWEKKEYKREVLI